MVASMTSHRIPDATPAPLSASSAFVVHLASPTTPELVLGRVEHIATGRSLRFASAAELIGFMLHTLSHDPELRPAPSPHQTTGEKIMHPTITKRNERRWSHRLPVALLALAFLAAPAWGRVDKTCLTGTDPAVVVDAGQIAALEAGIATACPCPSFDGSEGRTRRDYLRCVAPLIKAAAKSGSLRPQCKSRITQAYKLSTCGIASSRGAAPCIGTKANGTIRCRISTACGLPERQP